MSDFSSAAAQASSDADLLAEADAFVSARVIAAGPPPGHLSGAVIALQWVSTEITELREGQGLQAGDRIDVGIPIVAGTPWITMPAGSAPCLDPDLFRPGAPFAVNLKLLENGWMALRVDIEPSPAVYAARLGRGAVSRVSNDPPRQGRNRAPASNVSAGSPLHYAQQYVPNNEITFEFAAIGVEPTDPVEFQGPVDAEIEVMLISASDPSDRPELGRGTVRVVNQQRGYITFTGSSSDPIDPVCNYQVTVYNRINPSQGLTLRMWVWT